MGASHSHSPSTNHSHEAGEGHDHAAEAAHIAAHIGAYLKVGIGLLILTGLTVGLSYVDFGSRSMNIIVGMIVATVKASMVAAIFMHLKGEKITIWRFLIMTGVFAVGLFMLTLLAHSDPISGTSHSTH
jgi:cytochrome c oxidase subunit 4